MSKEHITVIGIDSETVKIIQAKDGPKGLTINKIIASPIAGLPPEACASSVSGLISQHRIKTERLIAVMSRRDISIRVLSLPSADKAELEQMVSLEAIKQIPFPAEETYFDYRLMETSQEGYSRIILSIAHKDVVNKILDTLNRSGLKPHILTLTTEGLYLWAKTTLRQQVEAAKALLVMDIDRNNIETQIISGEKILLSRISSFGAISLLAPAEYNRCIERLLLETRRLIDIYNREQGQNLPVEKLVITGSVEASKSVAQPANNRSRHLPESIAGRVAALLKDELKLDTQIVESATAFLIDDGAFSQEGLPEGTSISACLGAVFAMDEACLNMLPHEMKKRQEFIKKGKKLFTIAALSACLFIMLAAVSAVKFHQRKTLLNGIRSSVKKIAPATKELESKFKKVQMVQSHIEASKRSLTFLYELHKVIPQNVLLNYLSFDAKGRIILQGTTPAMSDAFKFVNMLEKSKKFKNVETRYVSKRRLKGAETVDFQITCELSL